MDSVIFDRTVTPDIGIIWCRVYCEEGWFYSPAAYTGVKYYEGRLRIGYEFTKYSGYPTGTRSMKELIVTEKGFDGTTFSPPEGMSFTADMKNGEKVDFRMDGSYVLFAMSRYGQIRDLSRYSLQGIVYDTGKAD